jgi:hypothetical protein
MSELKFDSESKFSFIFIVRVNPDNAEGTDSIRHFFSVSPSVLMTIPGLSLVINPIEIR